MFYLITKITATRIRHLTDVNIHVMHFSLPFVLSAEVSTDNESDTGCVDSVVKHSDNSWL